LFLSFPGLRERSPYITDCNISSGKKKRLKRNVAVFFASDVEQVIESLDVEMQRVRNDLKDATESGEKHT